MMTPDKACAIVVSFRLKMALDLPTNICLVGSGLMVGSDAAWYSFVC